LPDGLPARYLCHHTKKNAAHPCGEVNPKSWTKIFGVYYAREKKAALQQSSKVAIDPAV
jgi:hypothetical protein